MKQIQTKHQLFEQTFQCSLPAIIKFTGTLLALISRAQNFRNQGGTVELRREADHSLAVEISRAHLLDRGWRSTCQGLNSHLSGQRVTCTRWYTEHENPFIQGLFDVSQFIQWNYARSKDCLALQQKIEWSSGTKCLGRTSTESSQRTVSEFNCIAVHYRRPRGG
jgi:hypothetical protein